MSYHMYLAINNTTYQYNLTYYLLNGYDPEVRPVKQSNSLTLVEINLNLFQIVLIVNFRI